MACQAENIYYLLLYRKQLPTSVSDHCITEMPQEEIGYGGQLSSGNSGFCMVFLATR